MAGESPVLTQVRAAAALLDDEALAALANKGLVRRARKDLEARPPEMLDPGPGRPRFRVEDCTVELAPVPAQSTCTCASGGVCRHILAAIMLLRQAAAPSAAPQTSVPAEPGVPQAPAPAAPPPRAAGDEVLALGDDELAKWAGKALLRKAAQGLAAGVQAEFEEAGVLVVRFPGWNIVSRWVPGGGPAGMICSCHAAGPCVHRAAAVLAYQASRGRTRSPVGDVMLEESAGAVRMRAEVLASVGTVLREMVVSGLSRLSQATADRLRTLAVSAHGVDLPRIERLLRALADEVALTLTGNAQATAPALLGAAARTEALRAALARPDPAPGLVGVHRSHYEKVGDIELVGLGARRWRTRSGYCGLTVYYWDRSLKNWAGWSESRPVGTPDFDPAGRYLQDGPWSGCASPRQAVRSVLRVLGAWRNRSGRLSGRPGIRCLVTGKSGPADAPVPIAEWTELTARAARLFAGGLTERGENDEVVWLRPAAWGKARFDPVRQEAVQPIQDAAGRSLDLVVGHSPETAGAVGVLERHDPARAEAVLGLLRLHRGALAVEPVAIHGAGTVVNLTLDGLASAPTRPSPADAAAGTARAESEGDTGEEPEPAEDPAEAGVSATPVGQLLARMAEELEAIAESGVRASRHIDRIRSLAGNADSLGLAVCAAPLTRLADRLDAVRRGLEADAESDAGAAAASLLQAYYVVRFAAAQELVASAAGTGAGG